MSYADVAKLLEVDLVGAHEFQEQCEAHRADGDAFEGEVVVVPEVIKAEAERCHTE